MGIKQLDEAGEEPSEVAKTQAGWNLPTLGTSNIYRTDARSRVEGRSPRKEWLYELELTGSEASPPRTAILWR